MVALAAARRSRRDVEVELAACILAIFQCVSGDLAKQSPRIAGIEEQARSAFAARASLWKTMVASVARDTVALAPAGTVPADGRSRVGLARQYAADLGSSIDADAAAGLAAAMDLQLAKNQHPDVAWQRAVLGYGLTPTGMRSYIAAALRTSKDSTAASLTTAKLIASRALLAQVDRVGDREASAWSGLPVKAAPVAKAYDPDQLRDEDGKWTATGRARRLRVLDRPEGRAAAEPENKFAAATANPFAEPENKFATATANPFAEPENKFAAAAANPFAPNPFAEPENKFATATENKFAAAAANPFAPNPFEAPARQVVHQALYFVGIAPNRVPKPPEPEQSADGYGMYVPMQDVADYFLHRGKIQSGRHLQRHLEVDFDEIQDYLKTVALNDAPIELKHVRNPWSVAKGIQGIDDADWAEATRVATALWDDVDDDHDRLINQLSEPTLRQIALRAGYTVRLDQVKDLFRENQYLRVNGAPASKGPSRSEGEYDGGRSEIEYDDGLSDALSDYVVWSEPGRMGDAGQAMKQVIEDRLDERELDDSPIPAVFAFSSGLVDDEDATDMRGRYRIDVVRYTSAIRRFGTAAPNGKIALRETHLEPEGRV